MQLERRGADLGQLADSLAQPRAVPARLAGQTHQEGAERATGSFKVSAHVGGENLASTVPVERGDALQHAPALATVRVGLRARAERDSAGMRSIAANPQLSE